MKERKTAAYKSYTQYSKSVDRFQTNDVDMKIWEYTFIKDYGFTEYQAIKRPSFKLTETRITLRSKMRIFVRLDMQFPNIASEA